MLSTTRKEGTELGVKDVYSSLYCVLMFPGLEALIFFAPDGA